MGGRARADELTDVTLLAPACAGLDAQEESESESPVSRDGVVVASTEAPKTDVSRRYRRKWPKAKLIAVSGNYFPNLDQNLPKYGI